MNKREDTIQKFSTFLSFQYKNSNKNFFWQTDPKLEQRMRMLIESNSEFQADVWARYFLQIVKEVATNQDVQLIENTSKVSLSSAMAEKHLSAYLQEACLWTAQTLHRQFIFLRHIYSLEDYFQMANAAVNPPAKFLKNFNFEYFYTNIESYAKTAITRSVKNQIYLHDVEAKRSKFSDYALLKDLSNKELRECLILGGINPLQINLYCLVCQCFDEIYQPTDGLSSRGLEKPNQSHLEEIALCYNQRCNQLNLNTQIIQAEDIQAILINCIRLAREYRTKKFFPLKSKDENILDLRTSPLDIAIEQENRELLYLLVSKLFSNMSEVHQVMFKLWLGLNLTQTEIAIILKNKYPEFQKQYQIARQLKKASQHLLKVFIQEWNQANSGNLIDANHTELIQDLLVKYLQLLCQADFNNILTRVKKEFPHNNILIGANQNELNISNPSFLRESLQLAFQNELESVMYLQKESLSVVTNKLSKFIDNYNN